MLKFMKASLDGKKILALLMSVVLAMLILPAIPAQAAADTYEVGDYKGEKTQEEWTHPTQEGKVFAGWYADAEFTEVYEETTGTAYAKFVDATVLDLKKQLSAGASSISEKVSIRFLTGIDTLYYSNVTFHISIPDENKAWEWVETTAYSSILVDGVAYSYTAAEVFGEGAAYFVLHSLTGIPSTVFDKQFIASVSWTTLDGTTVNTGDKTFTINELIEGLDSDLYVINTANELLAFNSLCTADNDYFAGKTVKLGADITLTGGSETAPNWTPIEFSGVFDGQGHTISGVYAQSGTHTGFFKLVNDGAEIKNLRLVNSYFACTKTSGRCGTGSIAGRSYGKIENVYSSAIVKSNSGALMTGGIVGMIDKAGQNLITNCWFDGQIIGLGSTGGILGGTYASTATITSCLNTGMLNVESGTAIGGLVGYTQSTGGTVIRDSLNAGTLIKGNGEIKQLGTIIGAVHANAADTKVANVYGITEYDTKLYGYTNDTNPVEIEENAVCEVKELADVQGYSAYQRLKLNFDGGTWVLKKNAVPVLSAFGSSDLSLEEAKKLPDYRWYDVTADTYVISGIQQMHGYYLLSKEEDFAEKTIQLDDTVDVYTVSNAGELLAFAEFCTEENNFFNGKTVKLAADIALTGGSETVPNWSPIGFEGTFDGQGHTISGIYATTVEGGTYTGFFNNVYAGAVVKNMRLVDSYIEGKLTSGRCGTGSIAGRNYGTIENVYSSATVKNSALMTGGIVGMSEGGTVKKCWFDGQIIALGSTGGILGGSYGATATIEHCLNTGTISVESGTAIGGLCGYAQSTAEMVISDSLNAGTFVPGTGEIKQVGTIIGAVHNSATLDLTKVYGVQEFKENIIGWIGTGTLTGSNYAGRNLVDIKGYGAYQWTKLDFDGGTWVLKDGAVPVLGAFGSTDLSLEEAKKLPDFSWYDETADTYIIKTARQLLGFNSLCNADTDYFADKTVKLGGDISLTGGSETTPNWTPITLNGIFDGQGHTVSGAYVKTDNQYNGFFHTINSGATVKNMKLINSYIEGAYTGTENRAGVGSIVGRNYGTIDTVYSSATVVNSKQMTGGIAGMSFGGTIKNCWFDGQITALGSTGGILGGTYAANATLEHCLNTGTISIESGTAIGGLYGYAQSTGTITIKDSLNAGTFIQGTGTVKQVGTIIGAVHANAALTVENVYGATEFKHSTNGELLYGYSKNNVTVVSDSDCAMDTLANLYGTGAAKLGFDTYWTVREGKLPMLTSFETWADSLGK